MWRTRSSRTSCTWKRWHQNWLARHAMTSGTCGPKTPSGTRAGTIPTDTGSWRVTDVIAFSPVTAAIPTGHTVTLNHSLHTWRDTPQQLRGLADLPAPHRQHDGRKPEVALGDLTRRRPVKAKGWVASAPYLVWAPLPHDVPGGGVAFACVGAGSGGCLFIDLAAAPGAVACGGGAGCGWCAVSGGAAGAGGSAGGAVVVHRLSCPSPGWGAAARGVLTTPTLPSPPSAGAMKILCYITLGGRFMSR